MQTRVHTTTITVYDRSAAFRSVGELLHEFAEKIQLRIGYPMPDKNVAIIFLILAMTTDELGALTGRLGQIKSVKVKSTSLQI